jgi:multidrug efflux pump
VRVSDVGEALDSVEDLRNSGYANGLPSVQVVIFRQPGANIIDTVDRIRAMLPQLQASIPQSIHIQIAIDQTVPIRSSVHDVETTLMILVLLVVLVVFFFLRSVRTTNDTQRGRSRIPDWNVRRDVRSALRVALKWGFADFDTIHP